MQRLAGSADFLASFRAGRVILLIEGEAGIGKTTLLKEAHNSAVRLGHTVLSASPAESEVSLEFAGLADLLEWVPVAGLPRCPYPSGTRSARQFSAPRPRNDSWIRDHVNSRIYTASQPGQEAPGTYCCR